MPSKTKLKTNNKQKALLVTDDNSLAVLYDIALDHQFTKSLAVSYQEAQKHHKPHPPDLVFIDQALPNGDAEKLINEFYRNNPKTIIVLLVDRLNDDFVIKIWNKVNELLRKPVNEASFHSIIQIYGQFNDSSMDSHQFITLQISRKYTDPNFSEKVLARVLGITPAYLSKMYKSKSGITFKDALHKTRNTSARKLLKETNLLIKQVASQVGYRRTDSFIRNFQKSQGVSPSEFRRTARISAEKLK